jgi:hypothetical protein
VAKQSPLRIDDRTLLRALKKIEQGAREEAGRKAVTRTTKSVMRNSMKRTPVDEGDVRASHSFEVRTEGDTAVGIITVSDEAAFFVHEDLEANHPRGGEAKFLRNAMRARRGFFRRAIRGEFSKLLRKAGFK